MTERADVTDAAQPLAAGRVLAGRFEIVRAVHEDAIGSVLSANDKKTSRAIALRVIASSLVAQAGFAPRLREHCKIAAALSHRNVVGTFGVGTERGGILFVACEWTDGTPLTELIRDRSAQNEQLSLRGTYNILAHVCHALTHSKDRTHHGALRPGIVWVTRAGKIKVGDFGVGRTVIEIAGANALGPTEQACLAPEVKAGKPADERSDVFGVGAILYEMLTGRSAADEFISPSIVNRDVPPAVDSVLLKSLALDPAHRYATAEDVRAALFPFAIESHDVASSAEFGIDIDVDAQLASSRPPPPLEHITADVPVVRRAPPRAPGSAPQIGSRVSIEEDFRATAPSAIASPAMQPEAGPPAVDLAALLNSFTQNDAPRWMVLKAGLDHGPFSGRELVELILKGSVLAEHELLNMDTGQRRSVREQPELVGFLEQYRVQRAEELERQAVERSKRVETTSNAMKIGLAVAGLAVLGAGIAVYVITRPEQTTVHRTNAELAALYESGNIQITGTAGVLPAPPRHGARRTGGTPRSGGTTSGGGRLSYEEAMEQAIDLGDATEGDSMRQLTPSDVAGVMNRHINGFFQCVGQELRRGGSLGRVRVDLAIAGSGAVQGATVRAGSGPFQSCIVDRVQQVRFPSFSAPRMGASFSFSVDQ